MKSRRLVNKELLVEVGSMPCLICRKSPSDAHHIKSKKSGGPDARDNLWPLCREHHQEVHKIGLTRFSERHKLGKWLIDNGWEFSSILNRWIKEKPGGVI